MDKEIRIPLLSVRKLHKRFVVREGLRSKLLNAVTDVSFSLDRGEVIALVGESGSGKTTIARLICKLVPATEGEIFFEGKDILLSRRGDLAFRSKAQMIFQDPFGSLNPVHTVAYHLTRPLLRHGKCADRKEAIVEAGKLLETVGLAPADEFMQKHPHQMSGGQRQRVAVARALAVDPVLLLADEPTSMLDVSIRIDILNLLTELKNSRQLAYLYITHDLASARYFADRTMVMYAGHIVEGAPSDQLMDEPAHPYTRLLLSAVPDPRGTITSELAAKSGAPKLIDPPPGCPFAQRCPEAFELCRKVKPELIETGAKRVVRCHLFGRRS